MTSDLDGGTGPWRTSTRKERTFSACIEYRSLEGPAILDLEEGRPLESWGWDLFPIPKGPVGYGCRDGDDGETSGVLGGVLLEGCAPIAQHAVLRSLMANRRRCQPRGTHRLHALVATTPVAHPTRLRLQTELFAELRVRGRADRRSRAGPRARVTSFLAHASRLLP